MINIFYILCYQNISIMHVNNNHNDTIESLKKQIEEINKLIEHEKNKQKKSCKFTF